MPKRGSRAWYDAEIASKTEAALAAEADARRFELLVKQNGIQSAEFGADPPDRLWTRATTMAKKLWEQIAKVERERDQCEVGTTKKKVLTTANRIAALKRGANE